MNRKLPFDPDYFETDSGFPPEEATDVQTIGLSVADLPGGQEVAVALITARDTKPGFKVFVRACEYLMFVVAQNSDAGFEKALELLCEGATKYQHLFTPLDPPKEQKPDE